MLVVRYAALVALVVWLGAMQTAIVAASGAYRWIEYACGGVLLLVLVAMKFLGPPPRAFLPRVGVTAAMLAIAALERQHGVWLLLIRMGLGFGSLMWYVHE